MPGCIVGISPWTDLTLTSPACRDNAEKDPVLWEESLRDYATLYAKDAVRNPLVSPIYGDLSGLPPSLLFAGNHEILEDDSVRLHCGLEAAGSPCELRIEEGMWHVYVLYGIPEAKEALGRIHDFLEENL